MAGADVRVGNCKYLLNQQTLISGNDKVRRVSYAPQFAGINANEQQVAEQGTVAVVSFESEKTRKAAKGSAAAI